MIDSVKIIGNGSLEIGIDLIKQIADRLNHARDKHSWPRDTKDIRAAGFVVLNEASELAIEANKRDEARANDEAFDVAATAVRFLNREWHLSAESQPVTSTPCDNAADSYHR